MAKALPFIGGWLADRLLGDPEGWPHPVVGFGKAISLGEKTLNNGTHTGCRNVFALRTDTDACRILSPNGRFDSSRDRRLLLPGGENARQRSESRF